MEPLSLKDTLLQLGNPVKESDRCMMRAFDISNAEGIS
jgi:hypothetical protein